MANQTSTVTSPTSTVTSPTSLIGTGGTVTAICTIVGIQPISNETPYSYELYQNYPNPFNPNTTIQFRLPHSEFVTLRIFNILGEQIAMLVSKNLPAGTHQAEWDPQGLPGGVYFYRLQAGAFIQTNKAILLK